MRGGFYKLFGILEKPCQHNVNPLRVFGECFVSKARNWCESSVKFGREKVVRVGTDPSGFGDKPRGGYENYRQ